jgi:hypothetical protein
VDFRRLMEEVGFNVVCSDGGIWKQKLTSP